MLTLVVHVNRASLDKQKLLIEYFEYFERRR